MRKIFHFIVLILGLNIKDSDVEDNEADNFDVDDVDHPVVLLAGLHVKDSDMEEERGGGRGGRMKAALQFLKVKVRE